MGRATRAARSRDIERAVAEARRLSKLNHRAFQAWCWQLYLLLIEEGLTLR